MPRRTTVKNRLLKKKPFTVIPAKAGIHLLSNVFNEVDPGFRRGDDDRVTVTGTRTIRIGSGGGAQCSSSTLRMRRTPVHTNHSTSGIIKPVTRSVSMCRPAPFSPLAA
jgi:hypothetical protein